MPLLLLGAVGGGIASWFAADAVNETSSYVKWALIAAAAFLALKHFKLIK
jgi:hypothetical protein